MATRGRKPTPTAIKELEGNPGKRPLNEAEPKPAKKAPLCPKWLEPEAKKEWRRLSKQLEQIGVHDGHIEGRATGWVLLDYGDVVAHVFMQEAREYYALEQLWGDAKLSVYED